MEEESEHEGSGDSDSADSGDETLTNKPYMALLQSFGGTSESKAKRRKLDHPERSETRPITEPEAEGSPPGEDRDIDLVEEPEEDPGLGVEEGFDPDSDEEEDSSDPFDTHFATPNGETTTGMIKAIEKNQWATQRTRLKELRATLTIPSIGEPSPPSYSQIKSIDDLKIKRKLKESAVKNLPILNQLQSTLAPLIFNYRDILFCDRTIRNSEGLRKLVCLHAVNHVFKYVSLYHSPLIVWR
jgi:U3 small nucleolar RNA-associated protein 25